VDNATASDPNVEYAADRRISLTSSDLQGWSAETTSGALVAHGPCPTCGHDVTTEITTDLLTSKGVVERTVPPDRRMTRRFACDCTPQHKGRPPEVHGGCGRWWLAAVERLEGGKFRVIPASDEILLWAATTLDQAARDEVSAVRTSTEKWLPAVTALYGLFGLASVVVGKDSLEKIPIEGRFVIALLIIGGLVATFTAVYWGYRAAFGWFTVHDVSDDAKLVAWVQERRKAIVQAPEHLRTALTAAASALALLLIAVGVLWFWPPADPPSPVVEVGYLAGGIGGQEASACGPLKSGEGKTFVIQVTNGSTKVPITIDTSWVTSIKPKGRC
jgi:hypothetical protein